MRGLGIAGGAGGGGILLRVFFKRSRSRDPHPSDPSVRDGESASSAHTLHCRGYGSSGRCPPSEEGEAEREEQEARHS